MSKLKFHILFIIPLLISCTPRNSKDFDEPELTLYNSVFSDGFKIKGYENNNNSLISVFNPWQGAENIVSKVYLARDSVVPKNFKGQVIKGIPKRIVCMSSTHIAMLDALGDVDKVTGVSGMPYISNLYIQNNKEIIPDVGYEGNMNYEALLASKPDLVLLFSINGASSLENRLKELNIPFIYIGDYVEPSPLGKSEWIVVIAEILGKREKGIEIINDISERYNSLKMMVDTLHRNKPKVMLNTPFADSWFMPSTTSYVATMIKDAGGEYIYNKNTGSTSMPIDLEEAFSLVNQSDFWLNVGSFDNMKELSAALPKFANSKCMKNGKIFNNNKIKSPGGGNDCYESGVMHPDLILKDLIKIFNPDLIEGDFNYYKRLE